MAVLRSSLPLILAMYLGAPTLGSSQEPPPAELSNGPLRVTVSLPDKDHGFYRGTRFDWSGVIRSLEYKGHNYYGPWFSNTDPKVIDFIFDNGITAGPCSAITGPVEEFSTEGQALGFENAKPGETFLKIGVGVLRRPDGRAYTPYRLYEIVDGGKWSVRKNHDSVEFTQEVNDASSGYGYKYTKTVRLIPGKPEMVLEHSLQNTGRQAIRTSVYDHNFLVLDKQPVGPDYVITLPFAIEAQKLKGAELARIDGHQFGYRKQLEGMQSVSATFVGFGKTAADYAITIENRKVGAGMKISGDRPLSDERLWSIRSVLAIEPFVAMSIEPGKTFTWKYNYAYYTLGQQGK